MKRKRNSKVLKFLSSIIKNASTDHQSPITDCLFRCFTLVEITMAIAIIGIGMAGVMALLPIGFNASRDSIADNYSSDIAEQFLHVISQQCLLYKGTGSGSGDDGWGEWITDDPNTNSGSIPPLLTSLSDSDKATAKKPDITNAGMMVFGDTAADADSFDDMGLYYAAASLGGTTKTAKSGLYYFESRSGNMVDFTGQISLWQEPVQYDSDSNGTLDASIPQAICTRLCMEISWPFEKLYDKREKRYYVYELFNPVGR